MKSQPSREAIGRIPLITDAGQQRLVWLTEHPHAPRYTHPGYNRLTAEGLRRTRAFADEIKFSPPRWGSGQTPIWLDDFVERCFRDVPFYHGYGDRPTNFFDVPTCDRSDLGRAPWAFVPDTQSLDDLIVYNTSGTTGHPLDILTHADTLAMYVPLLQAALALHNLTLEGGADRVALAYVGFQKTTYTYATVMPLLDQAGFVKINLNPDEWRDSADRAKFLDDCNPLVYTGTPVAFAELAKLPLTTRPRALASTSMTLTPALAQSLETHFGCPVLDMYSLNESGMVSVKVSSVMSSDDVPPSTFHLLQPHLYVEVLDSEGQPCASGEHGEITLTGGFNPCLPLLRYRTGDYAALEFIGQQPILMGLEGRPPIVFRTRAGQPINNIDISIALRHLPIAQYALHQSADGALRMKVHDASAALEEIRLLLLALFGAHQALTIEETKALDLPGGKLIQYTSDLQ